MLTQQWKFKLNTTKDMFTAAKLGDPVWLNQVLKSNKCHVSLKDSRGLSCLHVAALECRRNIIEILVENYNADVNLTTTSGWTALHLCINNNLADECYKCLLYLVSQGANVNCCTPDKVYPLHLAASVGHLKAIELLLKHKAKVDVVDDRGQSPYSMAMIWSHKDAARVLAHTVWLKTKKDEAHQKILFQKYCAKLQEEKSLREGLMRTETKMKADRSYQSWYEKNNFKFNNLLLGPVPTEEREGIFSKQYELFSHEELKSDEKNKEGKILMTNRKINEERRNSVVLDRKVEFIPLSNSVKL